MFCVRISWLVQWTLWQMLQLPPVKHRVVCGLLLNWNKLTCLGKCLLMCVYYCTHCIHCLCMSKVLAVNYALTNMRLQLSSVYPSVSLSLSVSRCKANSAVAGVVCYLTYHHFRFSTNCVSTEGSFSSFYIIMEDIKFAVCISVCLFGMRLVQSCWMDLAKNLHLDRDLFWTLRLTFWWQLLQRSHYTSQNMLFNNSSWQCLFLAAIVSCLFPRWQHRCINTVGNKSHQSRMIDLFHLSVV